MDLKQKNHEYAIRLFDCECYIQKQEIDVGLKNITGENWFSCIYSKRNNDGNQISWSVKMKQMMIKVNEKRDDYQFFVQINKIMA